MSFSLFLFFKYLTSFVTELHKIGRQKSFISIKYQHSGSFHFPCRSTVSTRLILINIEKPDLIPVNQETAFFINVACLSNFIRIVARLIAQVGYVDGAIDKTDYVCQSACLPRW